MTRRRFISLEGSEGCGKTTQFSLLKEELEKRGEKVVVTREPGGTALGEKIRDLLKFAPEGRGMAAETELLLFVASRSELVRKVIRPALDEGKWVLSDRFSDSTLVYQGVARGLSPETIARVNGVATDGLEPGLTLLFDLEPEIAVRRVRSRALFDRIEEEDAAFFTRVREGFLHLAANHPERIKLIEAAPPQAEVAAAVWKRVADAFYL
jgi:dTMP kinase